MPHQERPRLVPRLAGSVFARLLPLLSIFDPGLGGDKKRFETIPREFAGADSGEE